jgi:hypothetical protein
MPRHPFFQNILFSRQWETCNNSSTILTFFKYTINTPVFYLQPHLQLLPSNVTFLQNITNSNKASSITI